VTCPINRKPVRERVESGNVEPELVAPDGSGTLERAGPSRRLPARGGITSLLKTKGEPRANRSSDVHLPRNEVTGARPRDIDMDFGLLTSKRSSRQHEQQRSEGETSRDAVAAVHGFPFASLG
jgi:hypothetical protein